jgi:hypothetical protein
MNTTGKYRTAIAVLAAVALFALNRPTQSAAGRKPLFTRPEIADADASPIYGVTVPVKFRRRELTVPSWEAEGLIELCAKLGNDVLMKAYRKSSPPFPDGTIRARVAWKRGSSVEYDAVLGTPQGFVPGSRLDASVHSLRLEKICLHRRLGIRAIHQRQASQ